MKRLFYLVVTTGWMWGLPGTLGANPKPQAAGGGQQSGQAGAAAAPQTQQTVIQLPGVLLWLMTQASAAPSAQSTTKQTQSISIDHGSTTLIDQSSGADLLSTALNLTPISSGTASGSTAGTSGTPGSGTATASAYAIRQLFHLNEDSLAPEVYNSHAGWRRIFFTVGREQTNTNSSSSTGTSSSSSTNSLSTPNSSSLPAFAPRATTSGSSTSSSSTNAQSGTVAGVKLLIWQTRDASDIIGNKRAMTSLQEVAIDAAKINATYVTRMTETICGTDAACIAKVVPAGSDAVSAVQKVIDGLSADKKAAVNKILSDFNAETKEADLTDRLNLVVQRLEESPQLSVSFQTTQRTGGLPDDYLTELIFDRGFAQSWMFTFNGSYDYSNSSKIGADLRTERAAVQLSRNIAGLGTTQKSPLQFNLSGEGVHQDTGWHYRAQLQLVFPITGGITFPISVGYGNETNALRLEEKGFYGKFGITADLGKLISALHPQVK